MRKMSMGLRVAIAVVVVLTGFLREGCAQEEKPRLGGCQTRELAYGLPAISDSLAAAAVEELLAPGKGPKTGAACRQLEVDALLFVKIGAVERQTDEQWIALAKQLTVALEQAGIRIAGRSQLAHTTGTCFPPYHIDFQACGDSVSVGRCLAGLPKAEWEGFQPTDERRIRRFFVSAGRSLASTDAIVDLK